MLSFMRFALAATVCAIAFPALAEDKPVLDVYTYDSFAAEWGPGPALKAGFEKTCGCTVKFTTAEDAISTLRKIQLEGKTTGADVLVGLDTATMGEARATGLFAPTGIVPAGLTLPKPWTDPDFIPFDYGYFAYVYNKEKTPNPPTSFEELIALPDSFKIVIEDPRSSTPGLGNVLWVQAAYGDRAPEIWTGLKPHILTMSKGWSEAYNLFLDGQADMVLSYTTSPAYHAIAENDTKYGYAPFTEGYVAQVEVAGIAEVGRPTRTRPGIPRLSDVAGSPEDHPDDQLDVPGDRSRRRPAGRFRRAPGESAGRSTKRSIIANSRAWVDAALAALQ